MPRGLIAVAVTLLLGLTPSLALACDARCLDGHAAQTSRTSHEHAGHPPGHQAALHGHAAAAHSSDAVTAGNVTAHVTGEGPAHHRCTAAFDDGAVDRQPVAAGLGTAPAGPFEGSAAPSLARFAGLARHLLSASGPGRASIPLRI